MSQGLLPQDVVVLAKLVGYGGGRPTIAQVAGDLALSPSQVHASLKRLERSRLIDTQTGRPLLKAVEEFLIMASSTRFRSSAVRLRAACRLRTPLLR